MEEIISIETDRIGHSDTHVVDARSLHEALGVGVDFSTWVRERIEGLELVVGVDFAVRSRTPVSRGGQRWNVDYVLTLDAAKLVAIAERNDRGRRVRVLLVEQEHALRRRELSFDPGDPRVVLAVLEAQVARMRALEATSAAKNERIDELERIAADADTRLEEVAGAVVLHGRLERAKGMLGFREAARALGARSQRFVTFLIDEGYCYRLGKRKRLAAIERYLHLAKPLFFEACESFADESGETVTSRRTWITPHGLERFAVEYGAWCERNACAA